MPPLFPPSPFHPLCIPRHPPHIDSDLNEECPKLSTRRTTSLLPVLPDFRSTAFRPSTYRGNKKRSATVRHFAFRSPAPPPRHCFPHPRGSQDLFPLLFKRKRVRSCRCVDKQRPNSHPCELFCPFLQLLASSQSGFVTLDPPPFFSFPLREEKQIPGALLP